MCTFECTSLYALCRRGQYFNDINITILMLDLIDGAAAHFIDGSRHFAALQNHFELFLQRLVLQHAKRGLVGSFQKLFHFIDLQYRGRDMLKR